MRAPERSAIDAVNVAPSLICAATISTELPPAPSLRYTVYPDGANEVTVETGAVHSRLICVEVCETAETPLGPVNAVPPDTTGVLRKWRRRAADECSIRAPRGAKPPAGATASDKATSIRRPEDIMARKSNATEATATANEVAAL